MDVLFLGGAFGNGSDAPWWAERLRSFLPDARWHFPTYFHADDVPAVSVEAAATRVMRWMHAHAGRINYGLRVVCYSTGAQILRDVLARGPACPVHIRRVVFWNAVPSGGVPLVGVARTTWAAPRSLAQSLLTGQCAVRSVEDVHRLMYSGAADRLEEAEEMLRRMHTEDMYGMVGQVFLPGMRVKLPPLPQKISIFAVAPDPDIIIGGCRYDDENVELLTTPAFGHHALIREEVMHDSDLEEIHIRAARFLLRDL